MTKRRRKMIITTITTGDLITEWTRFKMTPNLLTTTCCCEIPELREKLFFSFHPQTQRKKNTFDESFSFIFSSSLFRSFIYVFVFPEFVEKRNYTSRFFFHYFFQPFLRRRSLSHTRTHTYTVSMFCSFHCKHHTCIHTCITHTHYYRDPDPGDFFSCSVFDVFQKKIS
jgi:hypothetical protein